MPPGIPMYRKLPHSVHRFYRHLPVVVAHCTKIAEKGAAIGGENWTTLVQNVPGTARPRAYILPKNEKAEEAKAQDGADSTVFKIISGLRGS